MSASLTNLRQINLSSIYETLLAHRTASISTLAVLTILPLAASDYRTFLSYGPGGLPYNLFGWFIATTIFRPLAREPLSTSVYDDPQLPYSQEKGYLPESFPPQREGPRPKLGPHPVPQRQLEQLPDPSMRQKLIARFEELGKELQEKGLVDIKQSLYERQHEAFFVASGRIRHVVAQQTRGEISHVHAGLDGSVHVALSPQDCKKVLHTGWGQRHGLDGINFPRKIGGFTLPLLPLNYTLIYAPRNDEELEVVLKFVRAGVGFMCGSRDE